jgi:hypothetical protein
MELALSATLVSEPRAWSQRVQERWGLVAAVVVLAAVTIGLGAWGLWKKKSLTDDAARGVAPVAASPAVSHGEALTAKATLLRLVGSLEEPVPPGGKIAPGDRLSLRLQGIEPMHVYVLDEDREGEMFVLFPVPGVEPANPIQASRTVRLPGTVADSLVYWKVTSPGVRESLIAIGAREPIEELDSLLSYLPRVEPGRAVEMSASATSAARKLRGIGGLQTLPEAHRTTARRRIEELLPQLEDRRARRGDIWIWRTELANPVPKS